jgi:hypothetical protein
MKKGQLTLFIIIGLIILVSAGLVVYLTTQKIAKPVQEQVIVPEDARPVYDFVQGCANDIAREGLGILGLQGGFIDLPGIIDRTPASYIPLDTFNQFKTPLWYYEGEDRTPSLGYMEREIARYVNSQIDGCVGDFAPFTDRMNITKEGAVSTRTTIADDEVIVRVTWPLALQTPDRTTRVQDFIVRMPVRLKQMWALANQTMATENSANLFENATIDLMAADSDNIPLDGFSIECGAKRWRIPDVQSRLQQILYYNIPTARIQNTQYYPFTATKSAYDSLKKDADRMTTQLNNGQELTPPKTPAPDDAYAYFRLFYNVGAKPTDLKVGFEYQPAWGMDLSAQPSEGPVLKSNSGKGPGRFMRFLCINQWHFAYDVIYPIKVSIRDDKAFADQGFTFQFAFPVLINNNAPERVLFGYNRFQSVDYGAPEFCQTYGTQLADIRALGAVEGVPVLMELPDAQVNYACFNQECELGTTRDSGGAYKLETYLPRGCTNPFITATKDGYLPATAQLRGSRLDLKMTKLQDLNLSYVVHPYESRTKTWGTPRALKANERVSLSVSMVNRTFDQFLGFPTTNTTLELAQDTASYDIDAMLFLNDNQIGGYSAQTLKIPYEAVAGKTQATINLVEFLPSAVTDEQKLNMIAFIDEGDYRDALQPTFE